MSGLLSDPILRDVPTIVGFKVLVPCVLWDRIGSGGMGAVYLARHLNLDIDVAVKCLLSRHLGSDDSIARFRREARVAARLNHPNLVRVYDVLEAHGVHYLVMEYVQGETLGQRTDRRGPLSRDEALAVMKAAARGIAELHAREIVHRDLKPANLLVSAEGEVKVADFGLVRQHGSADGITQSGTAFGTLSYMPPEQFDDASKVGPPADIWSLGATMFRALVGASAYPSTLGETAIIGRILTQPFPDVGERRDDLDAAFLGVLRRCNAGPASDRFRDAGELLRELETIESGQTVDLADAAIAAAGPRLHGAGPPSSDVTSLIQDRLKETGGTGRGASDPASAGAGAPPPATGAGRGRSASPETFSAPTGTIRPGRAVPETLAPTAADDARAPTATTGVRRSRAPFVAGVLLTALALTIGAFLLHRPGAATGEADAGNAASARDADREDDDVDGTEGSTPETPEQPEPQEPENPDDRTDDAPDRSPNADVLVAAIENLAAEVRRAQGYRADIRVHQENIRAFLVVGGLEETAIPAAQRQIDASRRRLDELHANAVSEAVVVLAGAAEDPAEVERILDDEDRRARDDSDEERIAAVDALRDLVRRRPDRPEVYEGHARERLAAFFRSED